MTRFDVWFPTYRGETFSGIIPACTQAVQPGHRFEASHLFMPLSEFHQNARRRYYCKQMGYSTGKAMDGMIETRSCVMILSPDSSKNRVTNNCREPWGTLATVRCGSHHMPTKQKSTKVQSGHFEVCPRKSFTGGYVSEGHEGQWKSISCNSGYRTASGTTSVKCTGKWPSYWSLPSKPCRRRSAPTSSSSPSQLAANVATQAAHGGRGAMATWRKAGTERGP